MAKLIFNYPFMRREYLLRSTELSIGRDGSCDIAIPDYTIFSALSRSAQLLHFGDLKKISRKQARLLIKNDGIYLEDTGTRGMGSTYGTYVNQGRLAVKESYLLKAGDLIRFATIQCTFMEEDPAPPQAHPILEQFFKDISPKS